LDLNELKQLLQILEEKDIAEFEFEEEGRKLRIRKAGSTAAAAASPTSAGPPVLQAAAAQVSASGGATTEKPPAPAAVEDDGLEVVKSPIVGTFYRSPDPNSPPFVKVGDAVKVGQVLCIIEAMKLMNEIEAEVAGEIVKVHPENGQPVQYGEPLFALRPAR
jgi:acetyl-CoA carboxylase biotin carboxyl carrier protein